MHRWAEAVQTSEVYLMSSVAMSTATFTELLRKPKDVLAHVDEGVVRSTRRDGEDLVMVILRAHDLQTLRAWREAVQRTAPCDRTAQRGPRRCTPGAVRLDERVQ